ncbi:MAG: hypothetical protein HS122_13970 [Opitutaceae bacterium]|nr:hypothetical protein [Opitutaceae bacterium]
MQRRSQGIAQGREKRLPQYRIRNVLHMGPQPDPQCIFKHKFKQFSGRLPASTTRLPTATQSPIQATLKPFPIAHCRSQVSLFRNRSIKWFGRPCNQPGVQYVKGKATLTVEGTSENTSVAIFSLGTSNTLTPGLFVQPSSAYHGIADIKLVSFWKSQENGSFPALAFGGLYAGNVIFSGASGKVGFSMDGLPAIAIQNRLVINDIEAFGSAQPVLELGYLNPLISDLGRVRIASGDLIQPNGARILATAWPVPPGNFSGLYTTSNIDSHGRAYAPKALMGAKLSYFGGTPWQIAYDCIDFGSFPPVASGTTAP